MSEIDIRIVPRVDGIYDIFYHMDCVCDMWWWSLWMWEYSGENCEKKRECNTNTKLTWEVIEISWAHWLVVVFGCPLAPANDYTQFSKSLFAESLHSRRTCRPDRSATFDPSQSPIMIQIICQFAYVKVLNRSKHEPNRNSKNLPDSLGFVVVQLPSTPDTVLHPKHLATERAIGAIVVHRQKRRAFATLERIAGKRWIIFGQKQSEL